jgi:hypothetical protein
MGQVIRRPVPTFLRISGAALLDRQIRQSSEEAFRYKLGFANPG